MIQNPMCKTVWNRALDVVFDCYCLTRAPASGSLHPALTRLKEAATLVVRHFQKELVGARFLTRAPGLELPRKFLDELDLHLQIAAGLGFIEAGLYRQLACKLRRLSRGARQLAALSRNLQGERIARNGPGGSFDSPTTPKGA